MGRTTSALASEERRQQILVAALHVFARKGFTGATNRDIADEAGVTTGLIYHYFRDKRTLFETALAAYSPLLTTMMTLQEDGAGELAPEQLLSRLVTTLIGRLEASDELLSFQMILSEAAHDKEVAALFSANTSRVIAAFAGYLRRQIERGAIRECDVDLVAELLFSSLISLVIRHMYERRKSLQRYSPEQIADTLAAMTLRGLANPPC